MAAVETRQPSWIAEAPVTFRVEQEMQASPVDVWRSLVDYDGWKHWFPGVKTCRAVDHGSGVGSTRFVHMDAFKVTERITAWEPERHWAMTVEQINVPLLASMAESVTITPTPSGGSHVIWETGVATRPWAVPIRSILVSKTKAALTDALPALDRDIASRSSELRDHG